MGVRAGFPAQTYSLRSYSPAIPDALHYVTQCIPASSEMTERCSRSRAHGVINFSLSLKMCKDKVGLKYPFINLHQKSLNIRARKRTRTFNNFYYRTPNVYFFPALLFCTSRKKRKKIYLGFLSRVYLIRGGLFGLLFGSSGCYHLILRTHQILRPRHQLGRRLYKSRFHKTTQLVVAQLRA